MSSLIHTFVRQR